MTEYCEAKRHFDMCKRNRITWDEDHDITHEVVAFSDGHDGSEPYVKLINGQVHGHFVWESEENGRIEFDT